MEFLARRLYSQATNITAGTTITALRDIFSRHGLPEILVSDNGPQFTSREFEKFCVNNGIVHRTSAAYKPSTNGQAERVVQILKSAIKQAQLTHTDVSAKIAKFLLVYRNTPHSTTGEPPSLLLMGRRLRTRLDLLIPSVEKHVEARQYSTMVTPTAHRGLCQFHAGDPILARNYGKGEKWMPGVITEVLGSRHYMVEVSGNLWKRHVDQLLSRAVNEDHSNSPSSIGEHSMPLQLVPPVDFSDEVVPLPSGSYTATAVESQLTSTSECSESPLPGASCSITDNDNVTVVPPVLLSGTPDTSSMLEKPSYSDKVAISPCSERCYPVRVNRGLPSHLKDYELKC